ncbi:MAG: hypothetical protein FWF10_01025 [Clostridiales bacterium]|nr:hypothetical protein [Clostridiales bacterium]
MENVLFENRYEVTKQMMKSWYRLSQKRSGKLQLWLNALFGGLYAFLGIIYALLICIDGEIDAKAIVLAALFFCISLLSFMAPSLRTRKAFKQFKTFTGLDIMQDTFQFGDRIEREIGSNTDVFRYDQICFIEETDEAFHLWIDVLSCMIIKKHAFTVGASGDFMTFITERCTADKPFWTKRKFSMHMWKKCLPQVLYLVIAVALFFFFLF